jgi:archaeal chaperonin
MAEDITAKDENVLKQIGMTAMTGKGAEYAKEKLSELAVKAVKLVSDDDGSVDRDNIKIEKRSGGAIEDSELISGIVVDKERIHSGMPRKIKNAYLALLDKEIEIKKTEVDAKIEITSPDQLQAFLDQEEKMLKTMVEQIAKSGANVLICQKGIDDVAQHFLAKAGIYAIRRVSDSDMKKIAKATNGKVVSNLHDLSKDDLGYAGAVEEKKIGDDEFTYIMECKNPKAVTILVRGGTEHVTNEIERALTDAVGDIAAALKDGKIVAGAGAPEVELAMQMRKYAETLSGREQLAVHSFADSMEIIPRTLIENAGLDPIDIMTELKSAHAKKQKWAGVDVFTGKITDSWQNGVLEPLKIKTQAVSSASEVATMILRIDDVIASAGGSKGAPQMPPGMGGMGGMGGMEGMGM